MTDTRVLIIASDPLARAGLATLLSAQPGCQVVAQVSDSADLGEMVSVYRPDVALWDLGVNSSEAVDRFVQTGLPDVPSVVLLSMEGDAAQVFPAAPRGILMRNVEASRIAGALAAVTQGLVVFDPIIANALFPPRQLSSYPVSEQLTPREHQVLDLMAQGKPNKEIARRLGISEHTVKFHVNAILGKLHAQSRTEAVVIATRSGLVML